ncbi:MAG: hypothetical protein BWY21_00430 [Parcubacteria group bacterium ADurb.Bin216]|nr:MAG: hypothetical protein BWY21_00430 [Parcubacteria group bacterium ADurb.Bin216]
MLNITIDSNLLLFYHIRMLVKIDPIGIIESDLFCYSVGVFLMIIYGVIIIDSPEEIYLGGFITGIAVATYSAFQFLKKNYMSSSLLLALSAYPLIVLWFIVLLFDSNILNRSLVLSILVMILLYSISIWILVVLSGLSVMLFSYNKTH